MKLQAILLGSFFLTLAVGCSSSSPGTPSGGGTSSGGTSSGGTSSGGTSSGGASSGGTSSGGSGNSQPSVFCSVSTGGVSGCFGYTNLTAAQQTAVSNSCTQSLSGTVVTSCPSSGLVGCCKYVAGGIATEECYYTSDPSGTDQSECSVVSGTWSTGM